MHYPYFDTKTLIIYFIFGILCILSVHIAKGGRYSSLNSTKGFLLLFVTLFIFSVFRKVGLHLGGEDALRYQEGFITYFQNGATRFENTDVLFGYITAAIRLVTDNPYIYRGWCYSLIIIGYIIVIKYLSPQKISPIPFICILIPFMRSFGSMRNSMSIALFLIAIVLWFQHENLWCLIFVFMSVLTHRLSFVMIALFPFAYLYNRCISLSKIKYIIYVSISIFISYTLAKFLQDYIILFSLFEDSGNADMWYLINNQGANILLNWPMYLPHILLFVAIIPVFDKLQHKKDSKFLIMLFSFDIIILPASLVLGMWRFAEYLFIPNLILWGIIVSNYYKIVTPASRIIIRSLAFVGFSSLMLIRLSREWQDLSLMPYLFFWQ